MSTQKQIDANRRNALKSTGPRTPEGRAAVRLNGVKHGLCAETLILPGESESDYIALFDSLEAEHRPGAPTEEVFLSQFALATWRFRRMCHMEASFYTLRYIDLKDDSEERYADLRPSDHHSITFQEDSEGPNTLASFHRHEARLERSMYRALHELQRLQAARAAAEKETANQTQSVPQVADRRNLSAPKPRVAPPIVILPKPETAPETPENQPRLEKKTSQDDILRSVGGDECSIDG